MYYSEAIGKLALVLERRGGAAKSGALADPAGLEMAPANAGELADAALFPGEAALTDRLAEAERALDLGDDYALRVAEEVVLKVLEATDGWSLRIAGLRALGLESAAALAVERSQSFLGELRQRTLLLDAVGLLSDQRLR